MAARITRFKQKTADASKKKCGKRAATAALSKPVHRYYLTVYHTGRIVIGTAYEENMRLSKDLTSRIRQRDIALIAENTDKAVRTFIDLFSKAFHMVG